MERPLNTALGWRLPSWLLDYGPVAFVAFVGLAVIRHGAGGRLWSWGVLALAVTIVALLLRHRAPLVSLGVVLVLGLWFDSKAILLFPVLLGAFTVVEYCERLEIVAGVLVAAVVVVVAPVLHGAGFSPAAVLSRLVAVGLAVSAGLYLRARADYINGLRERAARLERERELLSAQAIAEERVRIARELHDVVAHNVSLMVVQAQALAATRTGDVEQAEALRRVADLGREAMSEMHRMLGVLRLGDAQGAEREPQPGVRDLPQLVARTQEAGLHAELAILGVPRELPPGVDLSAYRIVQEALTNVIRHAAATRATVTLAYVPAGLDLTVLDDGIGSAGPGAAFIEPPGGSEGHGLVGMRERVALFGGSLTAGRRGDGGYLVHAVLPLG